MHDHHRHVKYRDFKLSSSTKMDLAEGGKGCGVRKVAVSPKCQSSMSMGADELSADCTCSALLFACISCYAGM